MTSSSTTLLGSSLVFERTGQTLIAVDLDAISVVELGGGGQTRRIPIRDARAAAAFADQLWIATHDDQLARMDLAGRPLAPPRALPFSARALLHPAPCGPPAAIWSSSPPVALIDDFGQLAATPLADADLALPLTGRRFVTARGARLTLPSGLIVTLPPNTSVLGGAVMTDGKSAAILVTHAGGRQLLVVALGTGQIVQRCATSSSTIRIATRRSLAIVQLEPRVLRTLDLHAGRELGAIAFDHDVADFAIDPGGQRLAVRSDSDAIDLHWLADLLHRPAASGPPAAVTSTHTSPLAAGSAISIPVAASTAAGAPTTAATSSNASEFRTSPTSAPGDAASAPTTAATSSHASAFRPSLASASNDPTSAPIAAAASPRASDSRTSPASTPDEAACASTAAAASSNVSGFRTSPAGTPDEAACASTAAAASFNASRFRTSPADTPDEAACASTAAAASSNASASRTSPASAPTAATAGPDARGFWTSPTDSSDDAELRTPPIALAPRIRPVEIDRAESRRQLARELRSVALWTLGAIAAAWDSRKLGYGNEGKHPYELEVGAILGMNRGFAGDYLAAARDQLADHDQAIAGDTRWRAPDTAVGALIGELALDPLAVDIVLVIAAAALWGEIARLHGILGNDAGRAIVDELLVQQVLEARHDRHAVAAALDPRGTLVRLGIVHVGARRARPFAELTVDHVVLDRLRAVEPDLGPATAIRTADRDLAQLDIPRAVLAAAVTALARPAFATGRGASAVRIAVRGRVGSGRRTLSCALAARAGRDLAVIDALALPRAAEPFVVELRQALRRAQLTGLVPCIAHLAEVTFDERPGREVASEPLRCHPGPVIVIASPDEPIPLGPGHLSIELPVLAETERRAVWTRALAEAGVAAADVDALAARYKIGPGIIRQAVAAAHDAGTTRDAAPAIDAYIRQTRDTRLGQYARRVTRLASWSSVVFPPDILDSLRELVARVRHGRQVYETWGMDRTMATSRGLTALFQGQPGTGKTLVAGVIARELGLDLYQVDLSKVMSKWIGETERNLSMIFDAAEDGQVVLLFDEADSLFAKRTEVRSSNDRYANLEVNYLLQRLDAFEGIAILTTNSGNTIDPAFKRRLSFRLSFPFPDEETRAELWRAHLPPELPVAGPLTLDTLARKYQLSGGYIRNACLRAAFLAAQEETALQQHHLERAVALEFAELGKLSTTGTID